jgi:hypothetical protein
VSDVSNMRGFGDFRLTEAASLLGLGRRMIELEDPQIGGLLQSIGESVETGAEHQDLSRAFFDRTARRILGEPAAHRDEQAQASPLRPLLGERDGVVGVWPEDTKRERVDKDEPALQNLMGRPVPRRADRGHARPSLLHGKRVGAKRGPVEHGKLDAENRLPYRPVLY